MSAGREVVEVLNRCESAAENKNLDLSNCGLMAIPEAVYHIMKEVEVITCNISCNDLKKIPKKFSKKFPKITDLNLSHNKFASLPTELNQLSELLTADISHNKLEEFPDGFYGLANLKKLVLCNNNIIDVDVDKLCNTQIDELDLSGNPLSGATWQKLEKVTRDTSIKITMDPPKDDLDEMD